MTKQNTLQKWCINNKYSIQKEKYNKIPDPYILKNIIKNEVEEFRKSDNREEKQKMMVKRRDNNIRYNIKILKKIYLNIHKYFNFSNINPKNIKPRIVFCEDEYNKNIWLYFRYIVSSLTNTGYYGRSIRYMVVDDISGCVMGIVGIGSDFISLKPRDDYIGWNKENKFGVTVDQKGNKYNKPLKTWRNMKALNLRKLNNKINNISNVFVCISTIPFNELLTGKLLIMSVFSNEVLDKFENKYNQKLAGITTTSIYGKSIQYDRLTKYLKYVGLTKGVGTVQFSKTTIEKIRYYYNYHKKHKKWKNMDDLGLQPKAKMINIVCRDLGFDNKILVHSHKRGIYFGFTHINSKDFLCGNITENEIKRIDNRSFNNIVEEWKTRWLVKRVERMGNIQERKQKISDFYNVLKYDPQQKVIKNG